MKNILFVHGLNSDSTSSTGQIVKRTFGECNVYTPTFNVLDVKDTIAQINKYKGLYKIDTLVGHSLGGFYTLVYPSNMNKIVINPCMFPSEIIPNLKPRTAEETIDVTQETIQLWKNIEEQYLDDFDKEDRGSVLGIFGRNDKLFSYKDAFDKVYGVENSIMVDGEHKISEPVLSQALHEVLHESITSGSFSPFAFPNLREAQALNESVKNILCKRMNDKDIRVFTQYGDQIWKILEDGYRNIGGVANCDSIADLVSDCDLIKIVTKERRALAVCAYKFKYGRKVSCCSCLPTPEGKEAMNTIIQNDLENKFGQNMWAEVSGKLDHMLFKMGAPVIKLEILKELLKDKEIFDYGDPDIPNGTVKILNKETGEYEDKPEYVDEYGEFDPAKLGPKEHHYVRKIGKQYHTKIAYGNPKF